MIKKIILLFSLIFISFSSFNLTFSVFNSNCIYNWWNVMLSLENCVWDWETDLVETWWNLEVADWFKDKITEWTTQIATFLALGAIFSIVFGSLKMTLSRWEEEWIKKAKDIIKWWMLGLLWIVSAGFLISAVVKIIYSVWSV